MKGHKKMEANGGNNTKRTATTKYKQNYKRVEAVALRLVYGPPDLGEPTRNGIACKSID